MTPDLKKLVLLVLVFCLRTPLLRGQTAPDAPDCGRDNFAAAERLQNQKNAGHAALSQSLKLYRDALQCAGETAPASQTAHTLLGTGRVQMKLSQPRQALDTLSQALKKAGEAGNADTETQRLAAGIELNIAIAHTTLGETDEALADYEGARTRFRAIHDARGEAYTMGELCRINYLMGNHQAALDWCRDDAALRDQTVRIISSETGLTRQERDEAIKNHKQLKAAALDLTGRVYSQMDERGIARSYFDQALKLAIATDYDQFIAYIDNDIGALLLKQNQPQAAADRHREALEKLATDDHEGIAETRALMGDTQRALKQYAAAIDNYRLALPLQRESEDRLGEAQTLFSLGLTQKEAGNPPEALESLNRAGDIFAEVHHRTGEINARFAYAQVLLQLSRATDARKQIDRAVALVEEVRSLTPGPGLRATWFASADAVYRFAIDLRMSTGDTSDQWQAFDLFQRTRSRSLLDTLQFRGSAEPLYNDSEPASGRNAILRELEKQNRALQFLLSSGPSPSLEGVYLKVREQEIALQELDADARAKHPRLQMLSGVIGRSDIQSGILTPGSALAQFYLSSPHSYAWVIAPSGATVVTLPPRETLNAQVKKVLEFGEFDRWTAAQSQALKDLANELAPVFSSAENTRWIVVPDGALHAFPFALLSAASLSDSPSGGSRQFVKIPSIASLDAIRHDRDRHAGLAVAVFADPVFDALDSRVKNPHAASPAPARGASRSGDSDYFPRLAGTREEARLISTMVPPGQAVSYLDFAARPEAAEGRSLANFRTILFATHSLTDDLHPELSRIVLSQVGPDGQRRRERYLLLKDIYHMDLNADLVVLSSCRSAVGRQQAGEGPMSLSRAFLFAGSRAVIATLWEVDDQAGEDLMRRFYSHMLKDHLSPQDALARAQDEFRNHRIARFRNPYYWAGFELYGDWVGR